MLFEIFQYSSNTAAYVDCGNYLQNGFFEMGLLGESVNAYVIFKVLLISPP